MRVAALVTLLLFSAALVGCVSEDITDLEEDRITEPNLEDHNRDEGDDAEQITQEDCEERGGSWSETPDRE